MQALAKVAETKVEAAWKAAVVETKAAVEEEAKVEAEAAVVVERDKIIYLISKNNDAEGYL